MACTELVMSNPSSNQSQAGNLNEVDELRGQTFTMGSISRRMCKVDFFTKIVAPAAGNTITVEARLCENNGTSSPIGLILATSIAHTYTNLDHESDYSIRTFIFPATYILAANTDYCLLLYCTACSNCIVYTGSNENSYPNGDLILGDGSIHSQYDLIFYIYYNEWVGKINGITNPDCIYGIDVANISKVNGE